MVDTTYMPKTYRTNGGDRMVVASGGDINVEPGGSIKYNGVSQNVTCGVGTLDGTNPTPVAHGLTTVVSFVAQLIGTAAPGDNTSVLTANINGANVDVYAWKNTSGSDPTLVASTGTETFYWIAVGA